MTVNLSTLLFRVRSMVSEISVANMDDLAMYREIQKADFFVKKIVAQTVSDADLETPIVCLAAYYSHVTYTLLNARQLGTIDETVIIRQNELKKIAHAMLESISACQIDKDDLSIDSSRYEKVGGISFRTTIGVLNEQSF